MVSKTGPTRRRSIIRDFALNTSTHAVPGIARSQSIGNRIFWTGSLLVFSGIMCFFVVRAIQDYFGYPTQTLVSVIVEWPQAFPAVTICNYSPLRLDKFIGPFRDYLESLNIINATDFREIEEDHVKYIDDLIQEKLNEGEPLNQFFFPLDAMLMECNYNGVPCSVINFTSFIKPRFGLCHTFNARMKNVEEQGIRYNSDNGGGGLLKLRLYIHRHQYIPYLSTGVGLVTSVHDNAQPPPIDTAGIYLTAGQHHKLSYTKKINQFLPSPYTRCTDQVDPSMALFYEQFGNADYGYSQFLCYLACIQVYTYEKCGCIDPIQWSSRSMILLNTTKVVNASLCAFTNPCYSEAKTELMNTKRILRLYCTNCTQECSTKDFILKSSSVKAPTHFLLTKIKRFVESSSIARPINWSETWKSEIPESYLSMEISYETTRTEVYNQQPSISPGDVISNVGGQTGLWLGISFLSLMELAEMIFRLIQFEYRRVRRVYVERQTQTEAS